MNAPIRRVAMAVFVLFTLLFVNLNYVQVVKGGEYRGNPLNKRVQLQAYERERGAIVVDGQAIAFSRPTTGELKYERRYPAGELYAPVTGYKSLLYGETGIEQAEESVLSGDDDRLFVRRVSDIVTGRRPVGGSVVLTLRQTVQAAAYKALGNRAGAVVALDPKTGGILALVSRASYDPNPLVKHDLDVEREAWTRLSADPDKPMLNRALRETYPPGSTFKVVVSAAALAEGLTPASKIPAGRSYTAPGTRTPIRNFAGTNCTGDPTTLDLALTVSCNTAFAQLGVRLGAGTVARQAHAFGFDQAAPAVPLDTVRSEFGSPADAPSLAQSSIGQRDVRMTPLQGAMIAAGVANNGTVMKPYLVREITAPDLSTLDTTSPEEFSRATTPEVAADLQRMMIGVVERGTGGAARLSGVTVGGKTGTAENGGGRRDTLWFIGFAIVDNTPVAAVAVVLDQAGGSSAEATRIAGTVLQSAVAAQGGGG
ncbi:MAG TPA: penicillin-binding protein 2 [Mycobacteriales bacterium]|nr:penicillin-binding protein 2 [Mycobacteriales bacterium]